MPDSNEFEKFLGDFYDDEPHKTYAFLELYRDLYDLPTITKSFDANEELINFSNAPFAFFNVAAYNSSAEILVCDGSNSLFPNLSTSKRLLGRNFSASKGLLERQVDEYMSGKYNLEVIELTPIALLVNEFTNGKRKIIHKGIAFAAFTTGDVPIISGVDIKFMKTAPDDMIFQNREVFEIAQKFIAAKRFIPSLEEASSHKRNFFVEIFNKLLKTITFKWTSNKIHTEIEHIISKTDAKSVIDVSAGNDEMIVKLCLKGGFDSVVANDISWSAMRTLMKKAEELSLNIIFTNHNISEIPFKLKFDSAIVKNTLHHIHSKSEMLSFMRGIFKISENVLFIEIENPKRTFKGRLFNFYYEKIYGDGEDGHKFFDRDTFRKLMKLASPHGKEPDIKVVKTLRGDYLFCNISNKETDT